MKSVIRELALYLAVMQKTRKLPLCHRIDIQKKVATGWIKQGHRHRGVITSTFEQTCLDKPITSFLERVTMANMQSKGRWAKKRQRKKEKESRVESYRKVGRLRLQNMLQAGIGTKRSKDKAEADTKNKIYSKSTFNTYKNQFRYYCDWLQQNHPEVEGIDNALKFVDEYLVHLINKDRSAYSISTAKAALSKVFGVDSTQFIRTPPRNRENITRSRRSVERDKHISSEKERVLARFTSATGLRRAEMMRITAEDLFFQNGKAMLRVNKGTKGGKSRVVEIVGKTPAETGDIVRWIQSKKGRLFPKLSSNYDNHSYRASYARRVYDKYARSTDKIPKVERYVMRKDRAGEIFDKLAMQIASKNLGHNRISVIAQSYLYQ